MRSLNEPAPRALADAHDAAGWQRDTIHSCVEIRPLVDSLTRALAAEQYSADDCYAICLSLEEALANAVKHGNQNDPTKEVHVGYHINAERVLLEVEDQGEGFNPATSPNPLTPENLLATGGRGLFLMRSLMNSVAFNDRGNRVVLCKYRSPALVG